MRFIALRQVKSTHCLAKSVFASGGKVLLTAGQKLEPRFVKRLQELGFSHVYIEDKESADVQIEDVVSDQVRVELKRSLEHSLKGMQKQKATLQVHHLFSLLDEVIDEIASQRTLLISFMDIRSAEDYLYAHSVNTALMAITVGAKLISDKRKLKDLGVGALLHDAGMAHIPEKIVRKKARLTPPERKIMQVHTEKGYQMMKSRHSVSLLSAHVAYQHHERYDGKGYPRKLEQEQIHLYARITAVCSVYDALTSDRPYRKLMLPDKAFATLITESGKAFDPEVVKAFQARVAIYPPGISVRLSNGMEGLVVEAKPGMSHRPTVRIERDERGHKIPSPFQVDLVKERTIFIKKILV